MEDLTGGSSKQGASCEAGGMHESPPTEEMISVGAIALLENDIEGAHDFLRVVAVDVWQKMQEAQPPTRRAYTRWQFQSMLENPSDELLEKLTEIYSHHLSAANRGYAQHEEGMRATLLVLADAFGMVAARTPANDNAPVE